MDWYYEVFGRDNFFFELQAARHPGLHEINRRLWSWASAIPPSYIATNDMHYINPEDARLQDILLASRPATCSPIPPASG